MDHPSQSMLKNIVVIAGGNGGAKSICALKRYANFFSLSAIVPTSDSGGSSGTLRREFGVIPVGDVLRTILAFSPLDYRTLKQLFHTIRFSNAGKLNTHNLGNLFLVLAAEYDGNMLSGLNALHEAVGAIGTAHPVALQPSDLCVALSDGSVVIGEHDIDRPTYNRSLRITRAWLEPVPVIYEGARDAVLRADVIIFGPGSLYTSIIPPLLVEGMEDALRTSRARLVYVLGNAYETTGETGPTTLSDAVSELEAFLPRSLDAIVVNNHTLTKEELAVYAARNWTKLFSDIEKISQSDRLIQRDFEREGGGLDSRKLGAILKELVE